jgi:hypothetical protein
MTETSVILLPNSLEMAPEVLGRNNAYSSRMNLEVKRDESYVRATRILLGEGIERLNSSAFRKLLRMTYSQSYNIIGGLFRLVLHTGGTRSGNWLNG